MWSHHSYIQEVTTPHSVYSFMKYRHMPMCDICSTLISSIFPHIDRLICHNIYTICNSILPSRLSNSNIFWISGQSITCRLLVYYTPTTEEAEPGCHNYVTQERSARYIMLRYISRSTCLQQVERLHTFARCTWPYNYQMWYHSMMISLKPKIIIILFRACYALIDDISFTKYLYWLISTETKRSASQFII